MCVFPNLSRSVGGLRKPPERESAFFAERNCNSSPNFSFFLSPMTGAFAKSSHIRAKLLCGSFEQNSGMG